MCEKDGTKSTQQIFPSLLSPTQYCIPQELVHGCHLNPGKGSRPPSPSREALPGSQRQRRQVGPSGFSAGGLPNISVFRCSQTSLSLFLPPSNDCEAMLSAGVQRGATETQSRPRGPYHLMGAKGTKQMPPSTM